MPEQFLEGLHEHVGTTAAIIAVVVFLPLCLSVSGSDRGIIGGPGTLTLSLKEAVASWRKLTGI